MKRFDAMMDIRNVLVDLMGTTDTLGGVSDTTTTLGGMPDATGLLDAVKDTTNTSGIMRDTTDTLGAETNTSSRDLDTTPIQTAGPSGRNPSSDPLCFHSVHSTNIWVSRDGTLALRVWSDINPGVAFSCRPLRIKESVSLRVVEESSNCKFGVIRFGVSTADPSALPNPTPEYSTSYWATTLDYPLKKNDIFSLYVNCTGHIRLCINGKRKSIASPKFDTSLPFWALVDPWGKCSALQFVDASVTKRTSTSMAELGKSIIEFNMKNLIWEIRLLLVKDPLPLLRYPHPLEALSLHSTKGRNVLFSSGIVLRIEAEFPQGYVFSADPICPGQTLVIQILASEPHTGNGLAYGLTSCDPATLKPCDLPDIAEELPDRPEYWVVRRYVASDLCSGTEIAVTLTLDGAAVNESRDNLEPITVMHVDHTLMLWAFVDINEATRKVRLLTCQTPTPELSVAVETEPEEIEPEEKSSSDPECTICCENAVDSALYKCGHSCMCYSCAVQLWRRGGGKCPICRSAITDVIRVYKA